MPQPSRSMSPDRWKRVQSIFYEALECEPHELEGWLAALVQAMKTCSRTSVRCWPMTRPEATASRLRC